MAGTAKLTRARIDDLLADQVTGAGGLLSGTGDENRGRRVTHVALVRPVP